MFAAFAAFLLAAQPLQDSAHVVLVATAGLQGHATGWDYAADRPAPGGLERVAAVAESLRARYPGQVVLVDAGDALAGDPLATYLARVAPATPHPLVEAMNLAGYDAATPGERDLDWGVPFFVRATSDARFGYVSANLLAGDSLLFPAYRVVQRQGVRIAIAGVTTERARLAGPTLSAAAAARLRVAPIADAAVPALEGMRRDADVAVLLVHVALDGRADGDTTGEDPRADAIARLPLAPDVVVAGHVRRELRDSVLGATHLVGPGANGRSVSVVHLDLVRETGRWRVVRVRAELVPLGDRAPSALLARRLEPVDAAVRAWARTPIGLAAAPMRAAAARVQSAPLVELVNAVQRRRANADLAATSIADLRAGFDGDTIRVAHVLSLYPFDHTLRAVRLSGVDLKRYLEWSA